MSWKIEYRSRLGKAEFTTQAATREEAEVLFYEHLIDDSEFGVILRVTPVEV